MTSLYALSAGIGFVLGLGAGWFLAKSNERRGFINVGTPSCPSGSTVSVPFTVHAGSDEPLLTIRLAAFNSATSPQPRWSECGSVAPTSPARCTYAPGHDKVVVYGAFPTAAQAVLINCSSSAAATTKPGGAGTVLP